MSLAAFLRVETLVSLGAGAFMLYFPYWYCRAKKIAPETFGLRWFMTPRAWGDVVFFTILTLVPLTPVALYWSAEIPYRLELLTTLEFLSAGIAAAFIEETFFRGFLQSILTKKIGYIGAIFVATLAFGATHLIINPSWIRFATFLPGIVMGWLRWRHGSVMPAILYHALGNVWSVWFFPR